MKLTVEDLAEKLDEQRPLVENDSDRSDSPLPSESDAKPGKILKEAIANVNRWFGRSDAGLTVIEEQPDEIGGRYDLRTHETSINQNLVGGENAVDFAEKRASHEETAPKIPAINPQAVQEVIAHEIDHRIFHEGLERKGGPQIVYADGRPATQIEERLNTLSKARRTGNDDEYSDVQPEVDAIAAKAGVRVDEMVDLYDEVNTPEINVIIAAAQNNLSHAAYQGIRA